MRYGRIEDGVVREVIEVDEGVDLNQRYHASIVEALRPLPDDVGEGFRVGSPGGPGGFTAPEAPDEAELEARAAAVEARLNAPTELAAQLRAAAAALRGNKPAEAATALEAAADAAEAGAAPVERMGVVRGGR